MIEANKEYPLISKWFSDLAFLFSRFLGEGEIGSKEKRLPEREREKRVFPCLCVLGEATFVDTTKATILGLESKETLLEAP